MYLFSFSRILATSIYVLLSYIWCFVYNCNNSSNLDTDQDGIINTFDQCPQVRETYNMFEDEDGEIDLSDADHYYGEVEFNLQYKKEKSGAFPWLYIDFHNLKHHAEASGFECKLIHEGEHYDYLAQLTFASKD